MSKSTPTAVVKLLPTQWIEVKRGRNVYYLGVNTLLDLWDHSIKTGGLIREEKDE